MTVELLLQRNEICIVFTHFKTIFPESIKIPKKTKYTNMCSLFSHCF